MIKCWLLKIKSLGVDVVSTSKAEIQKNVSSTSNMYAGVFMTADDLQKLWCEARAEGYNVCTAEEHVRSYDEMTLQDYLTTLGIDLEEK